MTTKRISKSLRYSLVSAGLAWCVMNGNSHLVHASAAIRQAVPVSPYGEESGIFSDEPFYIDYTITAPEDWVYGTPGQDGYPFAFNQEIEDPFWYLQNGDAGVHHPGTSPANEKLLIVGGYCDPSTAADLCTITNGEEYEGGFSKGYIEYRFTEPGTLTMHIQVQTADTAIMSPDDTVCSEMASGYIATACLTYVMGMIGGGSPTVAPTTSVTPTSTPVPMCTPNQTSPPIFAQKIGREALVNSTPSDVAVDSDGNIYVVDSHNSRIMKFDSLGNYLTQWGSSGTGDGKLTNPRGITIDPSGNIYIVDSDNNRVQKFDSSGNYLSQWGGLGTGNGQFTNPSDITFDSLDNFYVTDTGNNRIQKFDSTGNFLDKWDSFGSGNGQFISPRGIAIDLSGNIYVSERDNNRIQKLDSSGNYLMQWGTPGSDNGQFYYPYGLTIDSSGNIYVTDTGNNRIQKFDSSGDYISKLGAQGTGNGEFMSPRGVVVDSPGNVLVVDTGNRRIQKFNFNPSIGNYQHSFSFGSSGTGNGQLDHPNDIAVDMSGYIYVVDTNNRRIQKFNSDGTYNLQWGSLGSGDDQFAYPSGIAIDQSNNIYITDSQNYRVQKFTSSGSFISKWGSWGGGDYQFYDPEYIAADDANNVYVSDSNARQVKKYSSSGTYLTRWGTFGGGTGDGEFNTNGGLVTDGTSYIYITDGNFGISGGRIQQFTLDGNFVSKWTNGSLNGPIAISYLAPNRIFVSDYHNNRVVQYDTSGNIVNSWGSYGSQNGQLNSARGLTTDVSGNVLVADTNNNRIQVYSVAGGYEYTSQWSTDGHPGAGILTSPSGVTVDHSDNIYVADTNNHRIQKFDYSGNYLTQWGTQGTGNGQFDSPRGITIDTSGNVYVVDVGNHRIQKFDYSGNYLTQWGTQGTGNGQLYYPYGITLDTIGNIYVVDENNHRIQKFNSADNYLTKWGKEGSGDGQFYYPNRITIDLLGDIYVTDASNHRIQKFDSSGNFLTKWGTEGSGNGQFVNPSGITIDSTGKIYVVDTSNNRIQKFDSSGNYLTKWGTQGASNGQLTNPQDIAMNSVGDIYIADTNNNRIQKYTYSKISTSPPAGGYSLTEGGSSKSYSLVLNAAPTKNTTISLSVSNPVSGSSITTSPSTLMFTASNWSTPQTVVISPDNDAIRTGDRVASIQYTVTSNDNTFSCVPLDETEIQIAEDDAPPTATPTPTQAPTSTPQPAPTLPPDIQKRLDEGYDVNGVCVAQIPGGMPEIFRIDMSDTKATLYIAPPSKPYGTFTISYQEVGSVTWGFEHPVYAGSPEYAIDFSHTDDGGVVVYTINDLRPNTRYEFKVKCANKCASTSYGNTVAAATNTLGATSLKTYTTGNHTLTRTTGVTKTSSSLLTNAGSPAGLAMITGFILLTLGVGVYRMKSKTPPITLSLDRPLYTKDNPRKIRVPPRTRGG